MQVKYRCHKYRLVQGLSALHASAKAVNELQVCLPGLFDWTGQSVLPPTLSGRDLTPTPSEESSDGLWILRQLLDLSPMRRRIFVRVRSIGRGSGNPVQSQSDRRRDGDAADLETSLGDCDAIERPAVWFLGTQPGGGDDLHGGWGYHRLAGGWSVRADGGSV